MTSFCSAILTSLARTYRITPLSLESITLHDSTSATDSTVLASACGIILARLKKATRRVVGPRRLIVSIKKQGYLLLAHD